MPRPSADRPRPLWDTRAALGAGVTGRLFLIHVMTLARVYDKLHQCIYRESQSTMTDGTERHPAAPHNGRAGEGQEGMGRKAHP